MLPECPAASLLASLSQSLTVFSHVSPAVCVGLLLFLSCCQALWEWKFQLQSHTLTLWVLLCRCVHGNEVSQLSPVGLWAMQSVGLRNELIFPGLDVIIRTLAISLGCLSKL